MCKLRNSQNYKLTNLQICKLTNSKLTNFPFSTIQTYTLTNWSARGPGPRAGPRALDRPGPGALSPGPEAMNVHACKLTNLQTYKLSNFQTNSQIYKLTNFPFCTLQTYTLTFWSARGQVPRARPRAPDRPGPGALDPEPRAGRSKAFDAVFGLLRGAVMS